MAAYAQNCHNRQDIFPHLSPIGDHTVRPHKQIAAQTFLHYHIAFFVSPSLPLQHTNPIPSVQWPWQPVIAPSPILHYPKLPFPINRYAITNKLQHLLFLMLYLLSAFLLMHCLGFFFFKVPGWVLRAISKGKGNYTGGIYTTTKRNLRTGFHVCAVNGGQGTRNVSGAEFPSDYTELLAQVLNVRVWKLVHW